MDRHRSHWGWYHWAWVDRGYIAKSLSIHAFTCYACIAHLDKKASEQKEGNKFTYRLVSSMPVKIWSALYLLHVRVTYPTLGSGPSSHHETIGRSERGE